MNIAAIASGSNGNCYYIGNDDGAVLVDAGVSCRMILERMERMGLDINKVNGILVSHEHIDHIRGIGVLSKMMEIPVFITEKTYGSSMMNLKDSLLKFMKIDQRISFGNIKAMPFPKKHDGAEPCSFFLSSEKKNVSVMTDIGEKCPNVVKYLQKSDAAFLESNYDDAMLENGRYPIYLKRRIAGENGHLSNYQASLLTLEHATDRLKHVFLSHLSANNNTPEIAEKTFKALLKERKDLSINMLMTSREKESKLVEF